MDQSAQPHASNGHARPAISIVIPAFNEAQRITATLDAVTAFFAARHMHGEIIIADDGSTDDTARHAREYAAHYPCMQVLELPHAGKASAVLAGLRKASNPVVGFMDVDLAVPLVTLDQCLEQFGNGADVAIASREGHGAVRVGEPSYRHAMGRIFNGLVRTLLLPDIQDTQCGFKFFTREALDAVLQRNRLYQDTEAAVVTRPRVTAFDVELLYIARRLGYRIVVIPVTWTYGQTSKVNPITDTLQNVRDVLTVRWNGWRGRYR